MPIALPLPRMLLRKLGFDMLYHYTPLAALGGILGRVTGRDGPWTEGALDLRSSSGFSSPGRLMRDYSVLDFELKLKGRGTYTYFFGGEPSGWGLRKNLGASTDQSAEEQGLGIIRIGLEALLARYDGPVFWRADDSAVVIRGSYQGPGAVLPAPIRAAWP